MTVGDDNSFDDGFTRTWAEPFHPTGFFAVNLNSRLSSEIVDLIWLWVELVSSPTIVI